MIAKRDFVYSPNGENRPPPHLSAGGYYRTQERYPVMYFLTGTTVQRMDAAGTNVNDAEKAIEELSRKKTEGLSH